jgi:ribosomal protein S18 acetylase RimI-like enzyme
MSYVRGIPSNDHDHKAFHDPIVHGLYARPLKSDRTIWQDADRRITVVTPNSPPAQRSRAAKVSSMVNHNTEYDGGIYDGSDVPERLNLHIFLYHDGNRVRGFMMLAKMDAVWRCRWDNNPSEYEKLVCPQPMWSVMFIWVHQALRHKGVAKRLFNEATRHLSIPADKIGWYTPFSSEGQAFAKSLYPDEFYIAK